MQQKNTLTLIIIILLAVVLIAVGFFYFVLRPQPTPVDTAAGNMPGDTQTSTGTAAPQQTAPVTLFSPLANQRVGTPISISGQTTLALSVMHYHLLDANGKEISTGFVNVTRATPDATVGSFRGDLTYISQSDGRGSIELFSVSDDGKTTTPLLRVPVYYTVTPEFMKG